MDKRFDNIRRGLKRGHIAAEHDKIIFNRYRLGEIEIEDCIMLFRMNNDIHRQNFTEQDFIDWLETIGFRRIKNGNQQIRRRW